MILPYRNRRLHQLTETEEQGGYSTTMHFGICRRNAVEIDFRKPFKFMPSEGHELLAVANLVENCGRINAIHEDVNKEKLLLWRPFEIGRLGLANCLNCPKKCGETNRLA